MRKRNHQGRFIKDEVSLTNDFKGLEINQDKPVKYANVVKTYAITVGVMALILAALALGHYMGWIEVSNNGGL